MAVQFLLTFIVMSIVFTLLCIRDARRNDLSNLTSLQCFWTGCIVFGMSLSITGAITSLIAMIWGL